MKHIIRTKEHGTTKNVVVIEKYTRSLAIKLFCSECLGFEDHPKTCCARMCPLFPYRGKSLKAHVEGRKMMEGEKSGYVS